MIEDQYGLRLSALNNGWPLPGQTLEETKEVITKNFELVKEKYADVSSNSIYPEDLLEVCLRIVIHYFYLYNLWRSIYPQEKNRNLTFLSKDYDHPYTYDMIIQFFKNKYPGAYASKSATMLNLTTEEVLRYEEERHDFYSRFR